MMKLVDGVAVKKATHAFSQSIGIAIEEAIMAKERFRQACEKHELKVPWHGHGIVMESVFAGPVRDEDGDLVIALSTHSAEPMVKDLCGGVRNGPPWFCRIVRIQFSGNMHIEVMIFGVLEAGGKSILWNEVGSCQVSMQISIFFSAGNCDEDRQLVYCEPGKEWTHFALCNLDGYGASAWIMSPDEESNRLYAIRCELPCV